MGDELFQSFVVGARHAWCGSRPAIQATPIDFFAGTNFRVSPSLHGTFDVVWLYEYVITDRREAWRGILDEAIRLLKEDGHLVIRCPEKDPIIEIKAFLGRLPTLDIALKSQKILEDGSRVSVYDVRRKTFADYKENSWSIGILSDGRKTENVLALIRRLESIKGDRDVEYLLAGPEIPVEPGWPIQFLSLGLQDNLPRIGEKKVRIVEAASKVNLAIFHDRYVPDTNFFEGFDEYGYDFDYVTVSQHYESGEPFPGYTGFEDRKLSLQMIVYTTKHDRIFDGHYLNGGLIILKTKLAKQINFNPLLLHFEGEDIEHSFLLADYGVTPRINFISSACTIGTPESYTATFAKWTPDVVAKHKAKVIQAEKRSLPVKIWMLLPESTRKSLKSNSMILRMRNRILRRAEGN